MSRDDSVEILQQHQPLVDLPRRRTSIQMRSSPIIADYTKFFAIILLVSTLLRPNAACNPEDLDWWRWRNPCEKVRTVRHGRDTELYGQLNNAIRHIEKDIPQLKRILVPVGTTVH